MGKHVNMSLPKRLVLLLCCCIPLLGQAAEEYGNDPRDPWEGFNRAVFEFNDIAERQKIEFLRKFKFGEDFDRLEKSKASDDLEKFEDEAAVREILAREKIIAKEFQSQSQKRLHELRQVHYKL